ncbi:MAG: 2-C-methyl-D-erythritol 4-phosphate cytidylyltransferase [Bacteroidota bacterium]|nr:2-C-methyl-D-erythritol 4-phosphate cytidylyltransferase [Bacteroidota bacterium]
MRITAIIPARGGSKRLEKKNIYPLNGKPLIAYTIEACKKSKYITDIYVSSDDDEILSTGSLYGAEPLKREAVLADDTTPKIIAIRSAVKQLGLMSKNQPEIIIVPQANSPQISAEAIDKGFEMMFKYNLWEVMSADSNGVQNAAFRIIKMPHLYNEFLSAHCGFVVADILDVHTMDDIKKLESQI